MTSLRYKGFHILTRPYLVSESRRWTVDLEIRCAGRTQAFSLNERYPTEEEADARCTGLGQRIIDGKVAGWSIDHRMRRTGMWPALNQTLSGEFGVFGLALIGMGAFFLFYHASAADQGPVFAWLGGIIVTAGALCVALGARAST